MDYARQLRERIIGHERRIVDRPSAFRDSHSRPQWQCRLVRLVLTLFKPRLIQNDERIQS